MVNSPRNSLSLGVGVSFSGCMNINNSSSPVHSLLGELYLFGASSRNNEFWDSEL